MKKTRTRENDAVFFMLLGLTAVFFCWRCRYGFAEADEAFYPTIAYRLTQGDRLLVDEWHMSQLSSVLLYLPVLLFTRLTGGTAGIYLALRYLYVAVQCLVAATVYLRLRRYHSLGAAAGALALAVYAPYGINALSYNSLGILLMAMTGALLVPAEEESRAAYILAGLSFAGSVLCCPYLIAVYLLYALFVFIPRKKKKLRRFIRAHSVFSRSEQQDLPSSFSLSDLPARICPAWMKYSKEFFRIPRTRNARLS